MSLISIILIIFFYISALVFISGLSYKLIQYWKTPAPLKIPIAPSSLDTKGVFLRYLREIFLFASLFKANKWTWLFGWSFHLALVLLFFRHLVYFWPGDVPLILYKTEPLKYAAYPLIFGLIGLLGRRLFIDRVRYISAPSDYLMLFVFIFIASTGMIMTFANYHPNLLMVKNFASGLISFQWSELPGEIIFLLHIFPVFCLIAVFPISKLLHAPGIFFSPTYNQVDNARKKRHISDWTKKEDSL
jgi:nitrate reductase gamma subunit